MKEYSQCEYNNLFMKEYSQCEYNNLLMHKLLY